MIHTELHTSLLAAVDATTTAAHEELRQSQYRPRATRGAFAKVASETAAAAGRRAAGPALLLHSDPLSWDALLAECGRMDAAAQHLAMIESAAADVEKELRSGKKAARIASIEFLELTQQIARVLQEVDAIDRRLREMHRSDAEHGSFALEDDGERWARGSPSGSELTVSAAIKHRERRQLAAQLAREIAGIRCSLHDLDRKVLSAV